MKKTAALAFTIAIVVAAILVSIPFNIKTVEATDSENYSIEHVHHKIEVLYNGYVFINDTIGIIGNAPQGTETLNHFLIGFPYKYGQHVLQCIAYDESSVFNVQLDVPLDNRMGFYAVEIDFPQPLNISIGATHTFTVGFILSNSLLIQSTSNSSYYNLDFPAYPSLTKTAAITNASIIVPGGLYFFGGVAEGFKYSKDTLPAFTYSPANVTFVEIGDKLQRLDVVQLKREISISELGEISCLDNYYLINEGLNEPNTIQVILPLNASNPSAQDQFGRIMTGSSWADRNASSYRVNFTLPLKPNESTRFAVKYNLPTQVYINIGEGRNTFNFTSLLCQNTSYYIGQASVTFILPEGAKIVNFGNYSVTRSTFQETLAIDQVTISRLESAILSRNTLQMEYEYNLLWSSFRPTLWMWTLAVIGCLIFAVWRKPRIPVQIAVPVVTARARPEYLKSFIDTYKEKRKIVLDLESLEERVQKGKIPRRRYKVQKKTLETRLNSLSRNLAEFKERMRSASSQFTELMRQLEIAETEINEVETNIKSIKTRHDRGELSLEAHRKLLADYERRKEKAETAIDGILLRLREETS